MLIRVNSNSFQGCRFSLDFEVRREMNREFRWFRLNCDCIICARGNESELSIITDIEYILCNVYFYNVYYIHIGYIIAIIIVNLKHVSGFVIQRQRTLTSIGDRCFSSL